MFMQKDDEVDFFRKKFAGSQADRIERAEAEAHKMADQLKKTKVSGQSQYFCSAVLDGPVVLSEALLSLSLSLFIPYVVKRFVFIL